MGPVAKRQGESRRACCETPCTTTRGRRVPEPIAQEFVEDVAASLGAGYYASEHEASAPPNGGALVALVI